MQRKGFVVEGQSARGFRLGKDQIDRVQDRLCRPEGNVQILGVPVAVSTLYVGPEGVPHGLKNLRIGALKAIDRLFEITDHERRPHTVAMLIGSVVEGLRQPADDGPLVGVCVLRLIDQHVCQTLIELEGHP